MKRHINTLAALLQQPRSRRPIAQQPPFRQCQLPAAPAAPALAALAAALLLAACSEAADGGSYATADDPLALRSLTVGVADAAETRGASDLTDYTDYMAPTTRTTGDQNTHGNYCCFQEDERFFAVASQGASLQTAVYQCGERQSNTSGGRTYYYNTATAEGQPLVASATGDTKIRAFAPYQAGGTTDGATVSVNHLSTSFSVQQTQTSGADLRASDLLYAEATMAAGQTAAVNPGGTWHQADKLSFQHQLSQLVIRFANSDANSQYPTLQRVTVTSGYRTIALQTASDGTMTLSTAAGALSDALSAGSPMTVFDGSQPIDNTETGSLIGSHPRLADRYHVCILPPQTLAAGTTLIQAETSVGTISYYLPQAQTLQAGRSYRITLPVAPVAQTGAVSIDDWSAADAWTYAASDDTDDADTKYHADGALLFNVGGVEFNMIRVKSGTASNADLSAGVTVAEDFYIGETEVTQALWTAAGQTLPTLNANYDGDRKPITNINVPQANTFIAALNTNLASQLPEGYEFALPTLDQWRYAFLGGCYSKSYKYSGSDDLNAVAWHSSAISGYASNTAAYNHDVATLQPNELGLYDMSGNVCEMVYKDAANTYWMGGSQQHSTAAFYQVNHSNNSLISTANHSWGCRLVLRLKPTPRVGDLYFSDGTWGTLADNTSGSAKTAADAIGIVFSTDVTDLDRAAGYTHGYVMALKEANSSAAVVWATGTYQTNVTPAGTVAVSSNSEDSFKTLINDMDGLTHCRLAGCTRDVATNASTLKAMKAAVDYNATKAAPAESSGWYLPSIGQLHRMMVAFAGAWANYSYICNYSRWTWRNDPKDYHLVSSNNAVSTAINNYVYAKLEITASDAAAYYTNWGYGRNLWASTERNATNAYNLWVAKREYDDNSIFLNGNSKKDMTTDHYVRAVLAF